ncbi:MAG: hypothetical protein SPF84_08240, partial [Lachnospiraceae bacterium]|nr:hypothetical protein [Lachnospiraceae bacterium]
PLVIDNISIKPIKRSFIVPKVSLKVFVLPPLSMTIRLSRFMSASVGQTKQPEILNTQNFRLLINRSGSLK